MTEQIVQLNHALQDRYEVERELGRGGMATVYLANDLRHNRPVAIKVLHPELAHSLGTERFVREVEIVAKLSHPHVLPLFDSGTADGLLYYVMPFIDGESLRDRLSRDGSLPVGEVIRLTDQIASALHYAHTHGVVHRDIKPENILLAGDQAVVADFGIARAVEAAGAGRLTGTGFAVGTPAYMSPEQASGASGVDRKTDVYALGCVVYEMLAGTAPFGAETPQALMAKHLFEATPHLRTSDPSIPLFIERAVERAMAKDPAERFDSASDFAAALTSGTVVARVGRRQRRRWAATAGVTVLVAVAAWWLGGRAGAGEVHAMAVLPLTNLTNDTTQEYFTSGVHEALIGELAQTGVTVISRFSVMRYRESDLSPAAIARELGVDVLVEGSVFREGDSVEIRARLIDPATGAATWTGSFDGNLPNVTALYRGLTRAVAQKIKVNLTPDAEARLARAAPVEADVYEAYLRGMHHLNLATPEDIAIALTYFNQAIERNPASAQAYAGLALAYVTLGHGPASPPDAWIRARAAAERSIRLDSTLADGWAALADVKTYADYDWEGAEQAFQRANALNPSLPMNHYHHAWYLALFGRLDEAITEHERARDLDPFTPFFMAFLGNLYASVGRYDEGIAEAQRAIAMQEDVPTSLLALTGIYARAGRSADAIRTAEELAAVGPIFRFHLAHTYARSGRPDDARRVIAEAGVESPTAWDAIWLARTQAELGNVQEAMDWLEFEPAHAFLPWVLTNLSFRDEFRNEPRFRRLLEKTDLVGVGDPRLDW
jgi:TolB-like protein/Flp pilus assembly protein TadD